MFCLILDPGETRKQWSIAEVTDKEYCQAKKVLYINKTISQPNMRERSGSVVECLTLDQRVAGSSLTGGTALCLRARHINLC